MARDRVYLVSMVRERGLCEDGLRPLTSAGGAAASTTAEDGYHPASSASPAARPPA